MPAIFIALLILLIASAGLSAPQGRAVTTFIDHYNLRKMHNFDEEGLKPRVAEIKQNIDRAKHYGIDNYILFSRSFEGLVNYDFQLEGLGDLTGVVYPHGGEHRIQQQQWARHLNEVLDYADSLGINVVFHTNQFDFPDRLYELAGARMAGSARVCPGKKMAYDALDGKIREFFTRFPKCDGLELTVSETQVKPTACDCDACRHLSEGERFARVAQTAVGVCKPLGKTVIIRTWGRFEKEENVALLPPEIICSTKFTLPDFHLTNYPNPVMGLFGERQEVEFDGWGEYSGYNLFPVYYGDLFAGRIKGAAAKDVQRFAIRLNWEPGVEPVFSKPYSNEANIHVFRGLTHDPGADPDSLLREYIASVFPVSAREAAFSLYKGSLGWQRTWLIWQGGNANDHSRIWRGRAREGYTGRVEAQIGHVVPDNFDETASLISRRRKDIDRAYHQAIAAVDALGKDVDDAWRQDLRRGARSSWYVAQGNSDCILMLSAFREMKRGKPLPDLGGLHEDIQSRSARWQSADPERYALLWGDSPMKMYEEIQQAVRESASDATR